MKSRLTTPILVLSLAGASADAHLYEFLFSMGGRAMIPPTDSPARGAGTLTYDHHTFNYDLELVITGVALEDLAPAGPNGSPLLVYRAMPGQLGDLALDPGYFGDFVQDGGDIRLTLADIRLGGQQGEFNTNTFDNESALYNGKLYFQLFTQQYPGGEIRGRLPALGQDWSHQGLADPAGLRGPPTPIEIPAPAAGLPLLLLGAARRRR